MAERTETGRRARRLLLVVSPALVALLTAVVSACDHPSTPSPVCVITLAPASVNHGPDGGVATVTVTTSADSCNWVAATATPWIALLGQPFGSGSGAFEYRVTANATTQVRAGSVVVGAVSHTVTQDGQPPIECRYTLSPSAAVVDAGGGDGTFAVSAPAGCAWTANSTDGWVVITSGSQGSGDGAVGYTVARHTGTAPRRTSIAVADQTFTIDQSGVVAVECQYSVAPVQLNACMPAGADTFRITTQSSCAWTLSGDSPWLTVDGSASGAGTSDIIVRFTDNYDAPRTGLVMVRWPTPTQGQNVRLSQAGCIYGVTPGTVNVPAAGGAAAFDVLQQSNPLGCGGPTQDACVWTAASTASWIVVSTPMPQRGDVRVSITVAPNTTGQPRSGTVTVRDKAVQITQPAS